MSAAERLLDLMPRPTAIFACNDEMAAGVIHVARQRGLDVPRDLSVVGFDDTPDRQPHLAAAHHRALADRVDGALGGA